MFSWSTCIYPVRFAFLVFAIGTLFAAETHTEEATATDAIKVVLTNQVKAWNRSDLVSFVASYASHCTLVGNGISELARKDVLTHYQQKYPSPASRGELAFTGLSIHVLDERSATATGHWHVQRQASAGGPIGGVFSVVLVLVDGSWQIVLDHTSVSQ